MDVEHFIFNVGALQLLGAREYRGESSIEFRMAKIGFFARLCVLAYVGALDLLIIIFSISIYECILRNAREAVSY